MVSPQFTQTKNLYNDIRDQLLNDPRMQMMLALRMQQLSNQLQTQINHDPNMTEVRAFQIMQQELQRIAQNLQTLLKQNFPPDVMNNPNSLRFSTNMTQVLNNPYSIAGEIMRDTAAAITEAQNTEHEANIQAVIAQAQEIETAQTQSSASTSNGDSDSSKASDSRTSGAELMALGKAASDAVKVLDHGAEKEIKDKVTNDVFKKTFGKEIEPHELSHVESAVKSPFERVPTPQSFASKVVDKEK